MKKLTVYLLAILAIAVVSLSFISCGDPDDPDVPDVPDVPGFTGAGVYNPGKKVSKVYLKMDDEAEYLAEEWEWNGNKLISISHFEEGELINQEVFTYENNRLIQSENSEGNYSEYFYADNQYAKVKSYDSTGLATMDIVFQYDGDKVTSLTVYNYGPAKNAKKMIERGFVGKLLPGEARRIVADKLANSFEEEPPVITLTYDGDNLSSLNTGSVVINYSDYDTHSNHYSNFFPLSAGGVSINAESFSKNNIGRTEIQYGSLNIVALYTYTYVDNFPATVRADVTFMGETSVIVQRIEYK